MYTLHEIETPLAVTHLINISYYRLTQEYRSAGEQHDFWELVYVDKGAAEISAGDTQYLLKQGELVLHSPNEYHNVRVHDAQSANILVVAFRCEGWQVQSFEHRIVFLGSSEKHCLSVISEEARRAFLYFDNVAPAVNLVRREEAPYGAEQIIKSSLETLFIYIQRRNQTIRIDERSLSSNLMNQHRLLAEQIVRDLTEHLSEKHTLSGIAAAHSISVSQLRLIFSEQMHTPVLTYLTELRIDAAKKMIRAQQYNFTQIAEATGFSSVYYFSEKFKQKTGMSPTDYARSVCS